MNKVNTFIFRHLTMSGRSILIIFAIFAIFVSNGQQVTVNCYPHQSPLWTGSCNATTYTQNSWIYAIGNGGQRGFAMFDVSSIPPTAIINSIILHFYVNTSSYNPYYLITKLTLNPVESPVSSVFNQIGQGSVTINSNTYYKFSTSQPSNIWKTFTLNTNAKNDLANQLTSTNPAWFGVGFYEYESNSIYWMNVHGWNQPNIPYLEVNYTSNFSNDIGLENIIPASPLCEGTYPVKFIVKNYGSNVVNTANINWWLNGVSQSAMLWSKPGGLSSGAADTVVMTTYNFNTGPITISGTISNPNGVNDTNAVNNSISKTIQVITLPAISLQPTDESTPNGGNAAFEVQASGGGLTFQWQVSINSGNTWLNVPAAAPYTTTNTNTLHISNATYAMSGYRYRCVIDGTCGAALISGLGMLTVGDPIILTAGTGYACPGETSLVPITVKNMMNISSFTITLNYNPANITYNTYMNLSSVLVGGTWNTTASGGKIQMTWSGVTPANISLGKICDLQLTFNTGINNLIWDTITPGNCSFMSFVSIDFPADYVNGPFNNVNGVITQQPFPTLVGINETAKFWVSSTGMPVYQWQRSTNGGLTWSNLSNGLIPGGNGANCVGVTTDTLKIIQCQTIINMNRFRCYLSMCSNTLTSGDAQLQVIKRVISRIDSVWKCIGDTVYVPIRVWNFDSVASMSLSIEYLPASLIYAGYQNLNPNIVNFVVNGAIAGQVRMAQYIVANINIPDNGIMIVLKFKYTGGCTYLRWDTINAGNCEYNDLNANSLPALFYSGAICNAKAVVTTQPAASTIYTGDNTNFTITAIGQGTLTYQWQVSTNSGTTWTNLTNVAPYSGVTNPILTLTGTPVTLNTSTYRCEVSGQCTPTLSNVALLTVNPQPVYLSAGTLTTGLTGTGITNSCEQDTLLIPIYVQHCNNICSFSLKLDFDPSRLNYLGWNSLNPNLTSAANFSCTTSGGNQVVMTWTSATSASPGNGILVKLKFTNIGGVYTGSALNWHLLPSGSCKFTNCNSALQSTVFNNGIINILPLPVVFNISPSPITGHYCLGENGVQISIDFSQTGVGYQLYKDGTLFSTINSISGTGQGFSFGYISQPGIYTCLATMTGSTCGRWMDGMIFVVVDTLAEINGIVKYDNAVSTSLSNVNLVLKNSSNVVAGSATSAVPSGTYQMKCLEAGTYTLEASTTRPWDVTASNSTDALIIAKTSVGSFTLTPFRQIAGDVNMSGYLNSADALFVMKRFVGTATSFPAGNWVWGIPNPVVLGTTVVTKNIQALMTGDVNGSFVPSIARTALYGIETDGQISISRASTTALHIRTKNSFNASAISLVIDFPSEKLEISEVKSELEGLLWNVVDGQIRIAWYSLNQYHFDKRETMLTILLRAKSNMAKNDLVSLSFNNECQISDEQANDVEDIIFLVPGLKADYSELPGEQPEENGYYLGYNSPNPFDETTQIEYAIPEAGQVHLEIVTLLGDEINILTDQQQSAGRHFVRFDKKGLAKGVYLYTLKVTDKLGGYQKTRMMVIK